jgi:hypothetical protein
LFFITQRLVRVYNVDVKDKILLVPSTNVLGCFDFHSAFWSSYSTKKQHVIQHKQNIFKPKKVTILHFVKNSMSGLSSDTLFFLSISRPSIQHPPHHTLHSMIWLSHVQPADQICLYQTISNFTFIATTPNNLLICPLLSSQWLCSLHHQLSIPKNITE